MAARVMLDVHQQCVRPKLLDVGSPLASFPKALLIEVYRPVFPALEVAEDHVASADVLIPGMYVSAGCLKHGGWHLIGHREVDPATVEFPETLINKGARAYFVRGEVQTQIDISFPETRKINAYKTEYPCGILGEIALYQLGRAYEMDKPEVAVKLRDLARSDLRFSAYRSTIHEQLDGEDDESYHELSRRMGHDLSRFYD